MVNRFRSTYPSSDLRRSASVRTLNIALIPVTSFPTYAQILINKYLIAIILDEGVAEVPEACDSQD